MVAQPIRLVPTLVCHVAFRENPTFPHAMHSRVPDRLIGRVYFAASPNNVVMIISHQYCTLYKSGVIVCMYVSVKKTP